jgi:hypothetical protein
MTLGAFTRRPDEVGRWLRRLNVWTLSIDKKGGQNKCKGDDNSQEHGTKRHAVNPREVGL